MSSNEQLSPAQQDAESLAWIQTVKSRYRLKLYSPYAKQIDFHALGATKRERLLRAGNQLGKSYAGAAEAAMHATGRYPDGWAGKKFTKPTLGWVGGVTSEVTRDTLQRLLIGPVGNRGTGMIPPDDIIKVTMAHGVADLADTIIVRHIGGGQSRIRLKYYEQGREKWQADTVDWVWFDEEPKMDIYLEGLTRTNATKGIVWMTFTPLLGMSDVVRRFLLEDSPDRSDTNMTIEDAEHISPIERQKIIDSYPAHEREARTKGVPILGSGRIFPIAESEIACDPLKVTPPYFKQIGGLDFGWQHPSAGVRLLYDADSDIAYVTHAYRKAEATPIMHASVLRHWGKMRWAWPHDGLQHSKDSGEQLATQYRREGLDLLHEHATYANGDIGVEAGLMDMLDRMQTGRLKVYRHLTEWFEEFLLYHRKDGKVVKERDDILCATRYAIMCLRHAEPISRAPKAAARKAVRSPNAWMGA